MRLFALIAPALLLSLSMVGCGGKKAIADRDRTLPDGPVRGGVESEPLSGRLADGVIALRDAELDDARLAFAEHLSKFPKSSMAMYHLGLVAMEEGNTAEARTRFEQALAANPQLHGAANNLGALYLQAGEDIAAERVLEQALALAPEDPRVLVNLAQVRLRRGLWSEAVEAYQKAIQIAPGHGSTLYGYALALMERMQWPAALKALEEAIDVRPRFARAYAAKVVCLHAMGRLAEAEQVAKQAIDELTEKSADLHIALARVWVEQKKIDEALEQLQLAAELERDNPSTSLAYGELLDAAGQKAEAIKQYQRFLKNPARRSEDSRRIRERLKVLGAPAKG